METRATATLKANEDAGATALVVIAVVLFVVLITCGCFFAPRAASLSGSCAKSMGKKTVDYAAQMEKQKQKELAAQKQKELAARKQKELAAQKQKEYAAQKQKNLHPIKAGLHPSTYRRGGMRDDNREYLTLRHPMGLNRSTVAMTSKKMINNAGFGGF
jgi:hypothetical protein